MAYTNIGGEPMATSEKRDQKVEFAQDVFDELNAMALGDALTPDVIKAGIALKEGVVPADWRKGRQGKGGWYDYIQHGRITQAMLGSQGIWWSYDVVDQGVDGGQAWAKGQLRFHYPIRQPDGSITIFTNSITEITGEPGRIDDGGYAFAAASSRALARAVARRTGFGLEFYVDEKPQTAQEIIGNLVRMIQVKWSCYTEDKTRYVKAKLYDALAAGNIVSAELSDNYDMMKAAYEIAKALSDDELFMADFVGGAKEPATEPATEPAVPAKSDAAPSKSDAVPVKKSLSELPYPVVGVDTEFPLSHWLDTPLSRPTKEYNRGHLLRDFVFDQKFQLLTEVYDYMRKLPKEKVTEEDDLSIVALGHVLQQWPQSWVEICTLHHDIPESPPAELPAAASDVQRLLSKTFDLSPYQLAQIVQSDEDLLSKARPGTSDFDEFWTMLRTIRCQMHDSVQPKEHPPLPKKEPVPEESEPEGDPEDFVASLAGFGKVTPLRQLPDDRNAPPF